MPNKRHRACTEHSRFEVASGKALSATSVLVVAVMLVAGGAALWRQRAASRGVEGAKQFESSPVEVVSRSSLSAPIEAGNEESTSLADEGKDDTRDAIEGADSDTETVSDSSLIRLEGRVVDQTGTPVPRAMVRHSSASRHGSVKCDGMGKFQMTVEAESMPITLVASPPPSLQASPSAPVMVNWDEQHLVLQLRECIGIEVRVRGEGGEPVNSFGWSLHEQSQELAVLGVGLPQTHASGSVFVCQPQVDSILKVNSDGYNSAEVPLNVGAEGPVVVVLERRLVVTGVVESDSGQPIGNGLVQLISIGEPQSRQYPPWRERYAAATRSSTDGKFTLTVAMPGVYRIGVSGPDITPTLGADLEVHEGRETTSTVLRVQPGGSLVGRIWNGVSAAPGATVELLRSGVRVATANSDSEGVFAFKCLHPGSACVRLASPPNLQVFVDIRAGEETSVLLDTHTRGDSGIEGELSLNGMRFKDGIRATCWTPEAILEADWQLELSKTQDGEVLHAEPIGPTGDFAIPIAGIGTATARLFGDIGFNGQIELERDIDLGGNWVDWRVHLQTGCVLLYSDRLKIADLRKYYLIGRTTEGHKFRVKGGFGSDQTMVFGHVPSGQADVMYAGEEEPVHVMSITVRPDDVARFEVAYPR